MTRLDFKLVFIFIFINFSVTVGMAQKSLLKTKADSENQTGMRSVFIISIKIHLLLSIRRTGANSEIKENVSQATSYSGQETHENDCWKAFWSKNAAFDAAGENGICGKLERYRDWQDFYSEQMHVFLKTAHVFRLLGVLQYRLILRLCVRVSQTNSRGLDRRSSSLVAAEWQDKRFIDHFDWSAILRLVTHQQFVHVSRNYWNCCES